MNFNALGYVGIRTKNLYYWADYGTRFLGMQVVDKSRGTLALRMDDRKQRVIIHSDADEGPSFYGWEVADAAALDALAARLEKHGVKVARGSHALAEERRVKDLIVFADPISNRLEAFHGAEVATIRSSPAVPFPASAPGHSAWAMPCSPRSGSTTWCRFIPRSSTSSRPTTF